MNYTETNPEIFEDQEEYTFYGNSEENNATYLASALNDDDENEEEEEEEEVEKGDWGHVDPAETNSPFPDPLAPTAPGSAV